MNSEMCSRMVVNINNILVKLGIRKLINDNGKIIILTSGTRKTFSIIPNILT